MHVVDSLSYVVTMLAGLESQVPNLKDRETLTIHVVGAGLRERLQEMDEEICHFLPKLKTFTIAYVGPEAHIDGKNPTTMKEVSLCNFCLLMPGRSTFRMVRWSGFYHDFTATSLFAEAPPDLIVAFHSQHSRIETALWKPTLERILGLDVPAVFTARELYETFDEENELEKMGARFTSKRLEENPWMGIKTYPKLWSKDRYAGWHHSNYWYIVKGWSDEWVNQQYEEHPELTETFAKVKEEVQEQVDRGEDYKAVVERMRLSAPDCEAVRFLKHLKSVL